MSKKRANGEGSLRKRATGLWENTIMTGYSPEGKRKCVTFYGPSQKAVKAKAEEYRHALADGLNMDKDYTFEEFSGIWLKDHSENIRVATAENYKYVVKTLVRYFGDRKIAAIKPIDVEKMLKTMIKEGYSKSYVRNARGTMFMIMKKAEANDLIRRNPVPLADNMRYNDEVSTKDSFSPEEIDILMEKLPDDLIGTSIRFLLFTGLRTQELLGLEPKHILPDGSAVIVEQAVAMNKGTAVIGPPKTVASHRMVPIPEHIRQYAIALRNTDKKYIWEAGKLDSPCNPSHFRHKYAQAMNEIPDVRFLTPHCCRHTYVTMLQARGVDPETIMSLTGQADRSMVTHYTHVQEATRLAAVNTLGQGLEDSIPWA